MNILWNQILALYFAFLTEDLEFFDAMVTMMNMEVIENFLSKLKTNPKESDFNELMALVDAQYDFTETAFRNGDLQNSAGENSGSCKLFSFAQLHDLNVDETLACFGAYYRDDVLQNPESDNHQNIRNFMENGWEGINFEGKALNVKS